MARTRTDLWLIFLTQPYPITFNRREKHDTDNGSWGTTIQEPALASGSSTTWIHHCTDTSTTGKPASSIPGVTSTPHTMLCQYRFLSDTAPENKDDPGFAFPS